MIYLISKLHNKSVTLLNHVATLSWHSLSHIFATRCHAALCCVMVSRCHAVLCRDPRTRCHAVLCCVMAPRYYAVFLSHIFAMRCHAVFCCVMASRYHVVFCRIFSPRVVIPCSVTIWRNAAAFFLINIHELNTSPWRHTLRDDQVERCQRGHGWAIWILWINISQRN